MQAFAGAGSDERRFRAKLAKGAKKSVKRLGLLASAEASRGWPGAGHSGQATGSRAHREAERAGERGRVRRWGRSAGVVRGCFRRATGSARSTGSFGLGYKWLRLVRVGPPKWLRLVTRGGGVSGVRIPRRRGGTFARTGPGSAGRG